MEKITDESIRRNLYTIRLKQKNLDYLKNFANENMVSIGRIMDYVVERILTGSLGDELLDDIVDYSKLKEYRL